MRDIIHEDCHVNALFAGYKEKGDNSKSPNWIITDMRFENELKVVEVRNGITIRINRNNGTRMINTNPHLSETALDNASFKYTIENDNDIENLIEKVKKILILEKII